MIRDLILLITLLSFLVGCQYEVTPWQTDANCSSGLRTQANIEKLARLENKVGFKEEFQVAIVSDPQQYPGNFEDVIKHVDGLDAVDFVIVSGDLTETGIKAEFEWTCKAMEKTDKPIFAVVGNHDAISFGKDIWLDVFGPYDFSFDYQGVRFIAYNDNKYEFSNVPDRDWLAEQAAGDAGRRYTIVTSHIAPWDGSNLSNYLDSLGVDLGLHGHEHRFDFWQFSDVLLNHHITSTAKEHEFALLTVNSSGLTLENCDLGGCDVAQVRTRDQ